jgi:acetolactate synthase-1/2/3 large subunit
MITGSEVLAKALRRRGIDVFFFIMGGPMIEAEGACVAEGMRPIDVRHEQAAVMMAHAYTRLLRRPAVCMAASGPGTTNFVTGIANAYVDCAPVICIGGSSPVIQNGQGAFQEIDQVEMMRPITRWSTRIYDARRIPDVVDSAFNHALNGKPGPVYLDVPSDVLHQVVNEDDVWWDRSSPSIGRPRPHGDPLEVNRAMALLRKAERPVIISGSGVIWAEADGDLRAFAEEFAIPVFTTPQGRGVLPEDHALTFLEARSMAFREADVVMVCGTRLNYVVGFGRPPRFASDCRFIQIDIDPWELGGNREVDVAILGDVGAVLRQMLEIGRGQLDQRRGDDWRKSLGDRVASKRPEGEARMSTEQIPIHPLRLCKEIRDFINRDAILVVDGQEILNYGRQSIPTFVAGHRLNSGPFGTMGVGLPFGLGAKVAKPDAQVLVLHGDGSFGLNAMEVDTAVRHNLPVVTVISNNGGWTAANKYKAGRELGFTRYDRLAVALGAHGEHVDQPEDIKPALERAFASGKPAVVNVVTDPMARAVTSAFSAYET